MPVIAKLHNNRKRPRRRPRRLKSLAFIPTFITLGNLLCGFAAIHFALRAMYELGGGLPEDLPRGLPAGLLERMLPSFLSVGAGLVILGGVFDALDGLLARVTRSTTDFGGQLDSLADVVTFGVAPAVLTVVLMTTHLAGEAILPSPISEHLVGRFAWVSSAVYVAFVAIRLARYNVEHSKPEFDHRAFRGLPSPGAAFGIAALIILQQDPHYGEAAHTSIVYALPFVALVAAYLMVSRIPYVRFHRTYLLGRKPFGQLVGFVAIFALFWLYKAPMLVLLVFWYWLSGPVALLVMRFRRQQSTPTTEVSATDSDSERKRA